MSSNAHRRLQDILEMALESVDTCPLTNERGRPFRHEFIAAVGALFETSQSDLTRAAMSNPNLDKEKKSEINSMSTIATLYIAAILAMIADGNAQWDEPTLLRAQFKHYLCKVSSTAKVKEIKTDSKEPE